MNEVTPKIAAALTGGVLLWCGIAFVVGRVWQGTPLPRRFPRRLSIAFVLFALITWVFIATCIQSVSVAVVGKPDKETSLGIVRVLVGSALSSCTVVAALAAALRVEGIAWRHIGLHSRHWRHWVRFGFSQVFFWAPLVALVNFWTRYFVPQKHPHPVQEMFSHPIPPTVWPLLVFTVAIAAPVFEELLFRGILQTALTRWIGPFHSIVATAVLFGFVHGASWPDPLPLFVFGLGLGYAYQVSRSLVAPIAMHAAFNFANLLLCAIGTP